MSRRARRSPTPSDGPRPTFADANAGRVLGRATATTIKLDGMNLHAPPKGLEWVGIITEQSARMPWDRGGIAGYLEYRVVVEFALQRKAARR